MANIDTEYLKFMIKEMDGDSQKIVEICRYCIVNGKKHQIQIVKVVDYFMNSDHYTYKFKINVVELMNRIIEEKATFFIRHFITRIKSFIIMFAKQTNKNEDDVEQIRQLFVKWKTNHIFADVFLKTLRELANPILGEQASSKINYFTKYTKSFLMAYRDINKMEATKLFYQAHCEKTKVQSQLESFDIKIDQLSNKQNQEKIRFAKQLLAICQQNINAIINSINMYQKSSMYLVKNMEEETATLNITIDELNENEAKEVNQD